MKVDLGLDWVGQSFVTRLGSATSRFAQYILRCLFLSIAPTCCNVDEANLLGELDRKRRSHI
jgi:hypothetical protein